MLYLVSIVKVEPEKDIYHIRNNGEVQELLEKDADYIYEIEDKSSMLFGRKKLYFIIEVNEGDILKYDRAIIDLGAYFDKDEVFYSAFNISEMFEHMLEDGLSLPERFEDLLKDQFSVFFRKIIKFENNGFDSSIIWEYYEYILEHFNKKVNEYVPQSYIDEFISMLNREHELSQVERISKSKFIEISLENIEGYIKAIDEVNATIKIAKELISDIKKDDIRYIENISFISFYVDDTPCGKVEVHINFKYVFNVRLMMNNDIEVGHTIINITKQCEEFESNFE